MQVNYYLSGMKENCLLKQIMNKKRYPARIGKYYFAKLPDRVSFLSYFIG